MTTHKKDIQSVDSWNKAYRSLGKKKAKKHRHRYIERLPFKLEHGKVNIIPNPICKCGKEKS